MLIRQLSENPQLYFAIVISVIVSIVLHELAHGWAAIKLGDDTPILTGHMTPNPIVHMGWFSIILACTVGLAWGAMPVNRARLRGKYADAIVAVAGPAMNVALAIVATVILAVFMRFGTSLMPEHVADNLLVLLHTMALINVALAILNMIPLPPLDGSKVLANFSEPYSRLLSDPTMQGVFMACTIAALIFGGRFIFPAAAGVVNTVVTTLLRALGSSTA